jgi:hypothetical protein
MSHSAFRNLLFFLLMLISTEQAVSQEWNSARLTILYGSSIPFNFNTIEKIKKGIEISTGTRFGITMGDSAKVGHVLQGFVLYCRAFNNQTLVKGDSYSLPLNKIRLKAENVVGLEAGTSYGYKDLTSDWVPLFTYTSDPWVNLDWANNQLNISFECGKPVESGGNGSLMGEEPDYYNVEVEFELVPTGPGF